jgi:Domain of unknown function (DUF397)
MRDPFGVWRKSTRSVHDNCVEIAFIDGRAGGDVQVGVRHSKDRHGPVLVFTAAEWEAFTRGVRDGEFDPPPNT